MYDNPVFLVSHNTRKACNLNIDSLVGNKPLLDTYRKYAEDRLFGAVKMFANLALSIEVLGELRIAFKHSAPNAL